ncbi:MAG: hypothetical protein R2865_13180 [Deinococcales bacterium]
MAKLAKRPTGLKADLEFKEAYPNQIRVHHAPNPVFESRWVLRALKQDLAQGYDPLDLAVILPARQVKALFILGG